MIILKDQRTGGDTGSCSATGLALAECILQRQRNDFKSRDVATPKTSVSDNMATPPTIPALDLNNIQGDIL